MSAGTEAGFGVYLHWPFCKSKCPYCDFNSHVRATVDQETWRKALLADLIERGLSDLARGAESVEALVVSIGAPRLSRSLTSRRSARHLTTWSQDIGPCAPGVGIGAGSPSS